MTPTKATHTPEHNHGTLNGYGMDCPRCKLNAAAPELLAACKQFVKYASNGKHADWETYLKTGAGGSMLRAISKAESPA